MRVIDRHILAEWLKMFGLLLAATTGLLLMFALYDNFRDLIDFGASPGEMAFFYVVALPGYLSVVLPLSMLLSLLYVLGKLHRANEITAIRAAGLNIFQTTRSLWLAAIALCGVSLLLNAQIVPWSVETSRQLIEGFELRAQQRKAPSGLLGVTHSVAFDNHRASRMWFINRYSRVAERAYGVSVSVLDDQRRELVRYLAREGEYDPKTRRWTFLAGRETTFDAETGDPVSSVPFDRREMAGFDEDPDLMLLIDRKPRDLSFNELRRIVDYFTVEENPKVKGYAVRYFGLMADTLGPLIILGIAIPFAASGVRVSPAVGVSKSIGLFLLFFVLTNVATALGGGGYLDPLWAALMPNLAMIGLAAWFFGRMR